MATTIPAVQGNHIYPVTLIDLDLNGNVYYISDAYKAFTVGSNSYTELGALLSINEITDNLRTTNGDIQITLSGIPSSSTGTEVNYLQTILTEPVKGGNITVKRAFMDADGTSLDAGNVYTRFKGIITNFAIEESFNFINKQNDYAVSVACASINSVLETRLVGQRTDPVSRKRYFPADKSFDRIPNLKNTAFDFGREYQGGGTYGGGGGGGGGGCFVKDTLITMADGTFKPIQTIKLGDKVVSYNFITELMDISTVKEITKPLVNNIVRLKIGNTVLKCTPDHPVYIQGKGWCSLSPEETKANHNLDVKTYEIGDTCVLDSEHGARHDEVSQATIEHIETQYKENTQTYNLSKVLDNHNFFANGILVHNKRGGRQKNISQA